MLVDEALVAAIAHDYDLNDPSQLEAATSILEGIADTAVAEEATGFNPSGTSQPQDDVQEDSTTETSTSHDRSNSRNADSSSAGGSVSTDAGYTMPRLTSFNGKTEEDKAQQLRSMFSELKPYDVDYALKKSNGDFQNALDDLLNVQYLTSTGQRAKGVDGFFDMDRAASPAKGKRKKGKKKGAMSPNIEESHSGSSTPSSNKRESSGPKS